jgi:hypothetical protein
MALASSRRTFLKSAAATTGAFLVVGFAANGALAPGTANAGINPFVRILEDGRVQVVLKHFEMGQGYDRLRAGRRCPIQKPVLRGARDRRLNRHRQ